jgi:hypothetical protein
MNNYLCNSTILEDVDNILKKGWMKLKNNYTLKKNNELETHELILLSGIRQYYVDKLFNCTIKKISNTTKKNSFYTVFGSTNITSDYDLTIISKNAPEIMKKIFLEFVNTRSSTLPITFDTNLYCIGYFLSEGINRKFKNNIINIGDRMSSFQPLNNNDKLTCLNYALIKLIEGNINLTNIKNINNLIDNANKIKNDLDNNLLNHKKNLININILKFKEEKLLFSKYLKAYETGKLLFSVLYKNKKVNNNLFDLMCMTQYYSIEGYYTPCTVNVVVIEMQKGTDLRLDKFNYLLAIIENLGDLNIHIKHEINTINDITKKKSLLNLSKYIYRIYYSLHKLDERNSALSKKLTNIKNDIVSHRSSGNINKVNFNLIDCYNNKHLLKDIINNFNNYIMNIISTLLPIYIK